MRKGMGMKGKIAPGMKEGRRIELLEKMSKKLFLSKEKVEKLISDSSFRGRE